MELRQLRYFLSVGDHLHFTKAADQLGVAQPSISLQIRNLETEMGVQLLERTSRNVRLTAAGRYFHREARRLMGDLNAAVQSARKIAEGLQGDITIGVSVATMVSQLPEVTNQFRAQFPKITLEFQLLTSSEIITALDRGGLDIGFVHPPGGMPHIESKLLWQHGFSLAVPDRELKAAGSGGVSLALLSGSTLIACDPTVNPDLHASILQICGIARCVPGTIKYVSDIQSVLGLVACGVGIGIVPTHWRSFSVSGVSLVPIEVPGTPRLSVAACWRRGNDNPLVRQFIDSAARVLASTPDP